MAMLRRKLRRDLAHHRAQWAAVALVVLAGVAIFTTLRSMHRHLLATQARYYAEYGFADVFAGLTRAPRAVARRVERLPGVAAVEDRIVADVVADVPGLREPATVRLVSVPDDRPPRLNRLHLRAGSLAALDAPGAVLASEAFARANGLRVGDSVGAVLHGRWQQLRIAGIALSPEFIYEIRGLGDVFPDNRRFGVLWMRRGQLETAFDLDGAFNDLQVALRPGAHEAEVIAATDRLLAPWGGLGAYGRDDHLSHRFVSDEIQETAVTSVLLPGIFLAVGAFLIHLVLTRLVQLQRDQVAVLKAFGYGDAALARHYAGFALVPVVAGGLPGAALGLWLARLLAGVYARFYQFPALRYDPEPRVAATALALSAVAALAGAWLAVRRAVRLPPAEAMRPEPPRRFRAGPLERLGLARLAGFPERMALRQLERRPARAAITVLTIGLAAALVVASLFVFDAVDMLEDLQFRQVQRADATVLFDQPRTPTVRHDLAREPGVTRVEGFRAVPVRLRHGGRMERAAITGLDADAELLRIVDARYVRHRLPADGLLLSRSLGADLGVGAGDTLTVELLDGTRATRTARVAGLVDDLLGSSVWMDRAALHRMLRESPRYDGAWLAVSPAARGALYDRLKRRPAVAGVSSRAVTLASFEATIERSFSLSLVTVVVFACLIAFAMVYNAARIALSERARELASLRVLGFTAREVAGILLTEQALLTLLALPAGALMGLALCRLIVERGTSDLFRLPLVLSGPTYLTAFAVVVAAALVSGAVVARRVTRLDLVEVLKARE